MDYAESEKHKCVEIRGKYYVLATHAKHLDIKEVVKKFMKHNEDLDYSDGFDEWKETRASLYELAEDGNFFVCSCPSGSKKYFCKHSVGLTIKFKHRVIPEKIQRKTSQKKGLVVP